MQIRHNLNLQLKNITGLDTMTWKSYNQEFNISVDFGKMTQVRLIDNSVLYIQFDNGELRLDMSKNDLNKIKEE